MHDLLIAPSDSQSLLTWLDGFGRDLPWRQTRDPWGILVSEAMLQQTQVSRVIDRWPRFLARFPTVADCAAAPAAAVIDEWSGLGYNRRAISLHRAANAMVEYHGGEVPADLVALLALPGVGAYTARAVRVFAFESDDGVVDTNIARILARLRNAAMRPSEVQQQADALVPPGEGWRWNQALFDVGALHCRPHDPMCMTCPLSPSCGWFDSGNRLPDPAIGSAGVSGRQSAFKGSDRQGRGRLVNALRSGSVSRDDLAAVMGWPDDAHRAHRVAHGLVSDGLAVLVEDAFELPR